MQHMAVISIPCASVITSVGQFSSKELGLRKLTHLGFTHTISNELRYCCVPWGIISCELHIRLHALLSAVLYKSRSIV